MQESKIIYEAKSLFSIFVEAHNSFDVPLSEVTLTPECSYGL